MPHYTGWSLFLQARLRYGKLTKANTVRLVGLLHFNPAVTVLAIFFLMIAQHSFSNSRKRWHTDCTQ